MACHPVVCLVGASTEAWTLIVMKDIRHSTTHMRYWGRGKSRNRPRFGYGTPQLSLLPGRKATHSMLERLSNGFRVPPGCGWHRYLTRATGVAAPGPSSPNSGEIFAKPYLRPISLDDSVLKNYVLMCGVSVGLHLQLRGTTATALWCRVWWWDLSRKSLVCGCGDVPQRVFCVCSAGGDN